MFFTASLRQEVVQKRVDISQEDLASVAGVTKWTLANYERGLSHPHDRSVYFKLAKFFDVDVNYFLTEDEDFLAEAAKLYGRKGQAQAEAILEQTAALFAGGELSDEDQIAFMHEIQGLFLDSKQRARDRFTPKKYRTPKLAEAELAHEAPLEQS